MRVCMVGYTFYESDNRVIRYAETLARRGDDVEVIALQFGNQPAIETLNGVTVLRIQTRKMKQESRLVYLVGTFLFMFRAMILLTRRHLKNPYQLVHVHSLPDFLVLASLVPRLLGSKVILDIHDLLPDFYASRFNIGQQSFIYKLLVLEERLSVALAQHVIISNHLWYDRVLVRSVRNRNCTVIINAPDRSIFRRGRRRLSDGKFIVLYPGSLNWHQGVDLAIRALDRIRDLVPGLELHICGLGPERDALSQLAQELGLKDRVLFLQFRSLREIAQVMCTADLGVVPKRKDSFGNEAFSTKILEFMACGVPVLVADTTIDRYYYNDSVVQFFEGGNIDNLAQALLELVQNPERRERLVRNASRFVETNDWATNQHIYLDLVDRLTGNCSAHTSVSATVA